jgi:hypothetical protein
MAQLHLTPQGNGSQKGKDHQKKHQIGAYFIMHRTSLLLKNQTITKIIPILGTIISKITNRLQKYYICVIFSEKKENSSKMSTD